MKRFLAVIAVLLVACIGTAVIPLLSIACWRWQVSPWLAWCAAPLVIVAMALAGRSLMPLTKRTVPEDESLPWREFGAVRRCELIANGLPESEGDEARFAINDANGEWISFRCRGFQSIPA